MALDEARRRLLLARDQGHGLLVQVAALVDAAVALERGHAAAALVVLGHGIDIGRLALFLEEADDVLDLAVGHERTVDAADAPTRSEEHTSELQSLMRISFAVFCLKKKT